MKCLFFFLLSVVSFIETHAQIITTVAGNGTGSYSGDGGPATLATINNPSGVAVDNAGNVYIADYLNNRIRKVDPAGIITTFAGTGIAGYSGNGGPATEAKLNQPCDIKVDPYGNVFICDFNNNIIRKVDLSGIITTVAGTGTSGFAGDGGPATAAALADPLGIAFDRDGNLYIADGLNDRIRKVNLAGIITTIAGNGSAGHTGDSSIAVDATLNIPASVAVDTLGNVFIADYSSNCIRKINPSGIIYTIAGETVSGYTGDGGPAKMAQLNAPSALVIDKDGNLLIADNYNQRIRKIDTDGIITTYAGTGVATFSGDGGNATASALNRPYSLGIDTAGNIYIADYFNQRIRKVSYSSSAPTVIASENPVFQGIKVYPNPANGSCTVVIPESTVNPILNLVDMNGKVAFTKLCEDTHEQNVVLDLKNITPGNYIIVVKCGESVFSQKLVIEN